MSQENISPVQDDLNEVMRVRRQKLEQLKELGVNPYPYSFKRTHFSKEIIDNKEQLLGKGVSISGRLMSIRGHGKVGFAHIMDSQGRIQIYVRKDEIDAKDFETFTLMDIGDIIGVTGEVFVTRTGETTIKVTRLD